MKAVAELHAGLAKFSAIIASEMLTEERWKLAI